MKQFSFNIDHTREEALKKLKTFVKDLSSEKDKPEIDIVHELQNWVSWMDDKTVEAWQDLQMLYILENIEQMSNEDLRDWQMGDIFYAGDVGDIQKDIKEELNRRME